MSYTVLGLGDSLYSTLHTVPKNIVSRFKELGGKSFYKVSGATGTKPAL